MSTVYASLFLAVTALPIAACAIAPVDSEGEEGVAQEALDPCPIAVKCAPGWYSVDTDGDGCNDNCVKRCKFAIKCAPGFHSVDSDGDGCNDNCVPD